MTMLDRLQDELGRLDHPVRSNELAARLGIQADVLTGMLTVLAADGRVESSAAESGMACSGSCGSSCDTARCPFIARVPTRFEFGEAADDAQPSAF